MLLKRYSDAPMTLGNNASLGARRLIAPGQLRAQPRGRPEVVPTAGSITGGVGGSDRDPALGLGWGGG
jgi:hypothetical protein